MATEIPYAPATVQQQSASHPPVLSAGRVTIAAMRVFENACRRFFQHKAIAEADRVESIIYNFEGSTVQSWVNANHARLVEMTFSQFLLEFKRKFLPRNWQDDLISTQISMQGLKSFLSWTEAVCEANTELGISKSDYHIAEDKLHAHFVPRLSPSLKTSYDANNMHLDLDKIANLDAWIERVHLLDTELENRRMEWLKLAISTRQGNTKPRGVLRNSSVANTSTSATGSTAVVAATPSLVPKLTQAEHDLLRAHRGCFRCRIFYTGHVAPNCTLGPSERPSPEAVKNCNLASALKAKAAYEKKQTSTVIAAVFNDAEELSDELLDGSDTEEYIRKSFSLPKHLWWTCCIDAPATCAPTPVRALIDHGSTPVLTSSEFADITGLTRRKLFKNLSVSGTFIDKANSSDTPSILDEYCKLQLQSQDAVWKAHVVNAVICPSLHTDIILGMDFLAKNKIVVDTELRTVVAKDTGYDLLNPPPAIPLKLKMSPHQQQKTEASNLKHGQAKAREIRRGVHVQLSKFFLDNAPRFDFSQYTSMGPDIIASVRTRIQQLAGQHRLQSLDKKFKTSFSDRFPSDIPHAR